MALSDCRKCWSTPCECGWEYRNLSRSRRIATAAVILGISEHELNDLIETAAESKEVPQECLVPLKHHQHK